MVKKFKLNFFKIIISFYVIYNIIHFINLIQNFVFRVLTNTYLIYVLFRFHTLY